MKTVHRDEIVDYVTYGEQRDALRATVMKEKGRRRILVGEHLNFLFENTLTIRYQIQEMMRAEQIVKEAEIAHEIATYNELLGDKGELGCTLLIEIPDVEGRATKLTQWKALPEHVYVELADGTRVRATFDQRQIGDERLSSVQYLKFDTQGQVPVKVGCDLPALTAETVLDDDQQAALREDLAA